MTIGQTNGVVESSDVGVKLYTNFTKRLFTDWALRCFTKKSRHHNGLQSL